MKNMGTNSMASALAIFLVWSVALAADTNILPLPVTGENSGPLYDIDLGTNLVDSSRDYVINQKDKPLKEDGKAEQEEKKEAIDSTEAQPGRVAIRRLWIYSDPVQPRMRWMGPPQQPWTSMGTQQSENHPDHLFSLANDNTYPIIFSRTSPLANPFRSMFAEMLPAGKDEASGDSSSTSERKEESRPTATQVDNSESTPVMRPFDDAHQIMLELLRHALSTRINHFGDFGSSSPMTPFSPDSGTNSDKPEMKTESKEDIVEIDGEKYLRKTVISKHVGENVMFMTKKRILTPLNATTSEDGQSKLNSTTEAKPVDKRQQGSSTTADKPVEAPATTPVVAASNSTDTTPVVKVSNTETPNSTSPVALEVSPTAPTTETAAIIDTIEKEGEVESLPKESPTTDRSREGYWG